MEQLLRKIVVSTEHILLEGSRRVEKPWRMAAAAAVLTNPWAGRGFVADLAVEIHDIAPKLGTTLVPLLLEAIGGADKVEAYGKAAVVGVNGEVEHASALIHTLRFGNQLREAVSGVSFLPFTNKRAAAGCSIDIPLKHITAEGQRSHFLTATLSIADAPGPDEIVVAIGASTGGRPHARIGDRYEDMKAMGVDQTGAVPA
ncbi:amino acid synthesis family protein [Pseudochelatococcus sp. B33]